MDRKEEEAAQHNVLKTQVSIGCKMRKIKEMNADVYMEWLRVNRPDKGRKIKREEMERKHNDEKKRTNKKESEVRSGLS